MGFFSIPWSVIPFVETIIWLLLDTQYAVTFPPFCINIIKGFSADLSQFSLLPGAIEKYPVSPSFPHWLTQAEIDSFVLFVTLIQILESF